MFQGTPPRFNVGEAVEQEARVALVLYGEASVIVSTCVRNRSRPCCMSHRSGTADALRFVTAAARV
jgi:hypothetical protein